MNLIRVTKVLATGIRRRKKTWKKKTDEVLHGRRALDSVLRIIINQLMLYNNNNGYF